MTDTRVEPVSAELERLLAAERDIPPAPAELRARALERARAAFSIRIALPERRPWRSRRTWLLASAAAIAFAALSFAALRGLVAPSKGSYRAPPSDENGTTWESPTRTWSSSSGVFSRRPPAAVNAPDAIPPDPPAPKKSERDAAPRRANTADAHALELGVLQRARAAVASGQFPTALDAIAEHQRRFPNGILQEEREALRVKALAGLGKTEEARKAALRFGEKFPNSVLSPRLEEATQKAP
jgi:hypothetical protein